MKTVVPHNPPDFSRIVQERAEKLSFDVDTLEVRGMVVLGGFRLILLLTGRNICSGFRRQR